MVPTSPQWITVFTNEQEHKYIYVHFSFEKKSEKTSCVSANMLILFPSRVANFKVFIVFSLEGKTPSLSADCFYYKLQSALLTWR